MADERIVLQLDTGDSAAQARALGLELEHVEVAAAGVGGTMGKSGKFGQGILGASYAVQDFTSVLSTGQGLGRALGSIQNNIPILVGALGAGAGLAGVISIVTVGVGLLIDNWDKIARLWGAGHTEEETRRMKDLAKATEAAAEAGEKLARTLFPEQRAGQKDLRRAVDAFGGPAVVKELREALVAQQGSRGAQADQQMAQTLLTNLMQGDRRAQELLGNLDLRGPVGQVLRGGRTPEEDREINRRRTEREAKEADEAAREKKAAAAKAAADAARQRDERWEKENRAMEVRRQARQVAPIPRGGGQDIHAIAEAGGMGAAARMQQAVRQQSGIEITQERAARMIQQEQRQLRNAQEQGLGAILQALSGQQEQIQMWRQATQAARRLRQPNANGGR